MRILDEIERLATAEKIYIHGPYELTKKIEQYIVMNINANAQFENEGGMSVYFLDSLNSFEAYMKEDGEGIYVVNMWVVSRIQKLYPSLYLAFEEKMKEVLRQYNILKGAIKLLYAPILKKTLVEKNIDLSSEIKDDSFLVDKRIVRCAWPWYNMYIRGNIIEWCCGYNHTHEKRTWDETYKNLNIQKEWNSGPFKRVREVLSSKDSEGNCVACHNLYFELNFPYIFDFLMLSKAQNENLNNVLYHYWRKDLEVSSYPLRYEMIASFKCNLKCIMCNQEEYNKLKYELPVDIITENKEHFKKAIDISLLGGEFFALKNAKEILDVFATTEFEHVRFLFITNGTLIHRYFEQLRKIKNMIISFSVDTIGKNYEHIRAGAKWERVEKNILDFLELYKQEKEKKPAINWQIQSPSIIMKSSIASLVEYVEWCVRHDIPPAFIKLEPYGVNVGKEDVFRHKELLNEIVGWKESFQKSFTLLQNKGWSHSFNTLNAIYRQLQ